MIFFTNKNLLNAVFFLFISLNSFAYNTNTLPPNLNNPVRYTEQTINFMLSNKKMEFVEGIYRCVSQNPRQHHRIAIFKDANDDYLVVFLNGSSYYMDWKEGDEMGFIPKEAEIQSQYLYSNLRWFLPNKVLSVQANLAFSGRDKNNLVLSFSDCEDILVRYTKEQTLFQPNSSDIPQQKKNTPKLKLEENIYDSSPNTGNDENYLENMKDMPKYNANIFSSGTCFAISKEDFFATNAHVRQNVKSFKLFEYQDGVTIEYNARLLISAIENEMIVLNTESSKFGNKISNLPLTKQVRQLKSFVFHIETYN